MLRIFVGLLTLHPGVPSFFGFGPPDWLLGVRLASLQEPPKTLNNPASGLVMDFTCSCLDGLFLIMSDIARRVGHIREDR